MEVELLDVLLHVLLDVLLDVFVAVLLLGPLSVLCVFSPAAVSVDEFATRSFR